MAGDFLYMNDIADSGVIHELTDRYPLRSAVP